MSGWAGRGFRGQGQAAGAWTGAGRSVAPATHAPGSAALCGHAYRRRHRTGARRAADLQPQPRDRGRAERCPRPAAHQAQRQHPWVVLTKPCRRATPDSAPSPTIPSTTSPIAARHRPGRYTRPLPTLLSRSPSVAAFVDAAFALLAAEGAANGRLLDCRGDPSLPAAGGPAAAAAGRVVVAANLRNSEGVAPNAALNILRLALWLPPGGLYVSIYEDGSGDGTRRWLALLQLLLAPAGVPFHIVVDGHLNRLPGEPRITHLARLRNQLVDPFFPAAGTAQAQCARGGAGPTPAAERAAEAAAAANASGASPAPAGGARWGTFDPLFATSVAAACFGPTQFLFLNDVSAQRGGDGLGLGSGPCPLPDDRPGDLGNLVLGRGRP